MISSYHYRGVDLFNINPNHSFSLLPYLSSIINSVFLLAEEDKILWMLSQTKDFTIKSYYDILNDGELHSVFKNSIWKCAAPLKVKIFTRLAFKDKILSWANLAKRRWSGPRHCEICGFHEECYSPLFPLLYLKSDLEFLLK